MAVVRIRVIVGFPGLLLGLVIGAGVRADRIVLRGGGQLIGKVIPDSKKRDRLTVLTETGKTPLSFQKAQVLQVIAEPSALDDYLVKRAKAAATAEAQYQLGLWCEAHKLTDLAAVHYEASLKQDKTYGPAHRKLGHVLYKDRWLTADELRKVQGLVKYKGKWISKEEREQREAAVAASAAQVSWVRRTRVLRQAIMAGPSDKSRDAQDAVLEIRDPVAVSPLVRVLGQDLGEFRMLLDEVLGKIEGPEAAAALVYRVLAETEPEVRDATMTNLARRKEENVIPRLVKALSSTEPAVVNRAAWSLSRLNAVATVPKLVPALITTQYQVVVPNSGGSNGGLGSVPPTSVGMGVPIYTNGSSLALLTPPVVGPGVVAYGATQVPFVRPSMPMLSFGGGAPPRPYEPKLVPVSYQNVEVLAALIKLTGHDFGFDIPTWKRWLSTSFHPNRAPARRVPQP